MDLETDICILGAGPGGTSAALKLSNLGIACTLVDKERFPRNKVCGDAISGKVTLLLNRLDPEMLGRFEQEYEPARLWGIRFSAPSGRSFEIPFESYGKVDPDRPPGYVSKRIDFDNFMAGEVRNRKGVQFLEGREMTGFEKLENGYRVDFAGGDTIACRLLIDASGAHSRFSRKMGLVKDNRHYSGSVRAYFKGVTWNDSQDFIELHYLKSILPGYFWIFPLPHGEVNAGLGLPTSFIGKRKIELKRAFWDIIENEPRIRDRFRNAELTGPLEGYGIPLGSRTYDISGDSFLIVGDAGYLVDPLTGEGIGNAMYSGIMAAEQAAKCLEENEFGASFMSAYDKRVDRVLRKEMLLSYRIQRLLRSARIADLLAYLIVHNKRIIEVMGRMYADLDLRERLLKPGFWLRMYLRRN